MSNGTTTAYRTTAVTVGEFLADQHLVGGNAAVSPAPSSPLADGMIVSYRAAVPVELYVGDRRRKLTSAAATVGDLLKERHIAVYGLANVHPAPSTPLFAYEIVQVTHRTTWTSHLRARIAPQLKVRYDANLPQGRTRTLAEGRAGYRVTTVRYAKSDDGLETRTVLASRVIRPRPRIIVRGLAAYASLAHVAAAGFRSVLRFAGSALRVIATAYSGHCYGCSGTTASGAPAGHGIVSVDPRVIPLGTHLYVPGYGPAVAGDTGGAIEGRRIDLGFDTVVQAERFGRRPLTVYILK